MKSSVIVTLPIGKGGDGKLTVKTARGNFSAPRTELDGAWWNSLAKAMA